MAAARLRQLREADPASLPTEPLLDFIPRVSPRLLPPKHLAPYVDILERALTEPLRIVLAAPPRHAKSETTIHALSWWIQRKPNGRFAYATYGQALSDSISHKARRIADRAGVELRGTVREWNFGKEEGAVVWTSIGGAFTGKGVDSVLVIDDPVKDRVDAESSLKRKKARDWFDDVANTRVEPGASIIVMATRWHPDDLSGSLIKEGWKYINLKAISDGKDDPLGRADGEALWPELRPASFLEQFKKKIFTWASLYQGEPRPRSGAVFSEPAYYDALPTERYRVAYGVDLAYTKKTSADFSVCLELWRYDPPPAAVTDKPRPIFYVVGVTRKQVSAPEFVLSLHARTSTRRGRMRWYTSGTETGSADFIKRKVPTLRAIPATADKYTRAQPAAEAWNDGRVLMPSPKFFGITEDDVLTEMPAWVSEAIEEVTTFTGNNDAQDDQVDALAAAFDEAMSGAAKIDPRYDGSLPPLRM